MNKVLLSATLLSGIVLLSQCSPKIPETFKTNATTPEAKVAEVKKNYTDQQLEEGHVLWQSNCDNCHKLFAPDSRDVAKWENVLPRMVKRSKLSNEDAGKVRAYLLANAKM